MGQTKLEARRRAYATLSSELAHLDDRQLRSTLKAPRGSTGAWGTTYGASVGAAKVFVKRIPLTDLEASRPWSTRNHFRLPTYYNYGVGSAGFGAFRELLAHITTTGWVLAGETLNFPMLLHHRITDRTPTPPPDRERLEQYVRHWNNRQSVAEFIAARAGASQELWLVIEHVPHQMDGWIMEHQDQVEDVIGQLFAAVSALRRNGMVHFDAHFGNVLTDGETVYLADFGLLNDAGFDLTKPERTFLDRHSHYDYAEVTWSLGVAPMWKVWSHPEESRAEMLQGYPWLPGMESQPAFVEAVIDNVDAMTAGPLAIAPQYAEALRRYREVILDFAGFYDALIRNPRKNTAYNDDRMRRLLRKADAPVTA